MSDIKLKPCPFCGGEAFLGSSYVNGKLDNHFVNCSECLSQTNSLIGNNTTKKEAIELWNKRVYKI